MRDFDELALIPIEEMDKDELELFAKQQYGADVDKRKSLENLRDQVSKLAGLGLSNKAEPAAPTGQPEWLKNPTNGRVFKATPLLLRRTDLLPCDESGSLI
ncbi:MAG: hypothetical protein HQL47_06115 [Gammaproteobacteria bacterium]|nr:hypothetical protein [Gammaproteobacteria bacterium]